MNSYLEKLKHKELLLVAITILLRLIPAIYTPLVGDLVAFFQVGLVVMKGGSPYSLGSAYAYPPIWGFIEALGVWLSEFFQIPFQIIIKIPLLISDGLIALLIYKLAKKYGFKSAFFLGLFYAVNPVSILITGFHGQFDTLMLFMILLSVYTFNWAKSWVSPLFLGIAIALKTFPILLVPFFMLENSKNNKEKVKYLLISLAPVTLLLLPYVTYDFDGVSKVLFSYAGWPDHGWVAAFRAIFLLDEKAIFARYLIIDKLFAVSKIIFLFAYGLLVTGVWKRKISAPLINSIAATFCLFLFLYGGISSQYLLWAVPFLILINLRHAIVYTILGSLALLGFYSVFYPDVIAWIFTVLHMPLMGDLGFYRLITLLFWGYLGIVLFSLGVFKKAHGKKTD